MSQPVWSQGGDKTEAHLENVATIEAYLAALRSDGRGLPAAPSRPFEISYRRVAEEAGVGVWTINRKNSQCRKLINDAAKDIGIRVRIKPRIRAIYTMEETISIAGAVIQAECESAGLDHRSKCKMADRVLRQIARNGKGVHDEGITAVSAALQQAIDHDAKALLAEIKEILARATTGELNLQTFHGRLKLEAALAGFSLSAVAKVTGGKPQTVVNWGAGRKAPTRSLFGEITKIEQAIGCPIGYLSQAHRSNCSGSSNVKRHHLPDAVHRMSIDHQKQFRRLIDPELNISKLSNEQRNRLMEDTLRIFRDAQDTPDFKRAKLRSPGMQYGLKALPDHVQQEFDDLAEVRTNVFVRDDVKSRDRGWDPDTRAIYHGRMRLFLGWLHFHMGVAKENLSIAYLGFDQVLREYDNFLIDRKRDVGLERRWAHAVCEWYAFAATLTRRPLELDLTGRERDEPESGIGWLRGRRDLLLKLKPIERPRVVDHHAVKKGRRDDIRPVLTSIEIENAARNWSTLLDETTAEYRYQQTLLKKETTLADGTRRIEPILRLAEPLLVIETAAWDLRERLRAMKFGSFHWCTAIRESVALKLLAQCPLRRKTFCGLTCSGDGTGMVFQEGGWWWLRIPADLFKNEKSQAFRDLVVNGNYLQRLEDMWGFYDDLVLYVTFARKQILGGADSSAFYVARQNGGHVAPTVFSGVFRNFTREYIAENRGRGTGWRGVRPFGSQAMRHIVAAATWKRTKDEHAMALAIHDSVRTAKNYYHKYYMGTEERAEVIRGTMQTGAGPFDWSSFDAVLPRVPSPPTAPSSCGHSGRPSV